MSSACFLQLTRSHPYSLPLVLCISYSTLHKVSTLSTDLNPLSPWQASASRLEPLGISKIYKPAKKNTLTNQSNSDSHLCSQTGCCWSPGHWRCRPRGGGPSCPRDWRAGWRCRRRSRPRRGRGSSCPRVAREIWAGRWWCRSRRRSAEGRGRTPAAGRWSGVTGGRSGEDSETWRRLASKTAGSYGWKLKETIKEFNGIGIL